MPKLFESLGMLKGGKLTPDGKKIILERIRHILSNGGEKSPFPCKSGKNIQPVPPENSLPDDIEDENKYPEFHNTYIKQYESVLISQNVEGNFSLGPPFIDPVALAAFIKPPPGQERPAGTPVEPNEAQKKLAEIISEYEIQDDADISIGEQEWQIRSSKNIHLFQSDLRGNIPKQDLVFSVDMIIQMVGPQAPFELASILDVRADELISKLALPPNHPDAIIKPPAPPSFELPIPPVMSDPYLILNANISRPLPAPGFEIPYPDKIEFDMWQFKMPKLFASLLSEIASDPSKLLDLVSPSPKPCFIIDAAEDIGMFGSASEGEVVRSAVQRDLIVFKGQCMAQALTAQLIGQGGKPGAVGMQGSKFKTVYIKEDEVLPTKDYKSIAPTGGGGGDKSTVFWNSALESMIRQEPEWISSFFSVCDRLNVNPDFLMNIIAHETANSFSHLIVAHGVGGSKGALTWNRPEPPAAIGLIMFSTHGRPSRFNQLKVMTVKQQFEEVYKYYVAAFKVGAKITSAGDMYAINAGIGNSVWDGSPAKSYSEYKARKDAWDGQGAREDSYHCYWGNYGFDANKDFKINKDEIKNFANKELIRYQRESGGKRINRQGKVV